MLKKIRIGYFANSLFRKLIASFTLIIFLLVSFNFFSFTFFRDHIREEIIRYNTQNLKNTTVSYENHLNLVYKLLLGYYNNERVLLLNKPDFSYVIASQLRTDIQITVSNELLYLEDIAIYFESTGFLLDKDSSTNSNTFFTKFYFSPHYPMEFWKQQFADSFRYRVYPAVPFVETTLSHSTVDKGVLFPIALGNRLYPDIHIIAYLKAQRLFETMHRSVNEKFIILDPDDRVIYSNQAEVIENAQARMTKQQGYFQVDDHYWFYHKGELTGFTFISVVSNKLVSAAISRLNVTLITLLILALAISFGTSLLFSIRFNTPVQKIVESIRRNQNDSEAPLRTDEFQIIGEAIHLMQTLQHTTQKDLAEKTSLLKSYAFFTKLKKIHHSTEAMKDLLVGDRTFVLVLFRLSFLSGFYKREDISEERATYFFREYIRHAMHEAYPDSHTLQIENDQILTLVFDREDVDEISNRLLAMKEVFDRDREDYYFTIALSTPYQESTDFAAAYDQVVTLLVQRAFNDRTEVLVPGSKRAEGNFTFTPAQAQEFESGLSAGNGKAVTALVSRMLATMEKKEATSGQFSDFARDIIERADRISSSMRLGSERATNTAEVMARLRYIHNAKQMGDYLSALLHEAADQILRKREERDPLTGFVMDYLKVHYMEEITLDKMAEKLNITGGYLSTYFKEKTGMNFLEYVNDVRIRNARELLETSDMKIQEIAEKVGYQNLNSFNRMFKKFTGVTPSEFRKNRVV